MTYDEFKRFLKCALSDPEVEETLKDKLVHFLFCDKDVWCAVSSALNDHERRLNSMVTAKEMVDAGEVDKNYFESDYFRSIKEDFARKTANLFD